MPVKGLTDQPRRFPRLGKIRLGTKNERGIPRNQPFFVVPEEVQAAYGQEPTELNVVFISDEEEDEASVWYRAYSTSNGPICKGDGERAWAKLDEAQLTKYLAERKGEPIAQPLPVELWAHKDAAKIVAREVPCNGQGLNGAPPCPMFEAKRCGIRGFFQFAVRDVPGVGVYQMDTGSMVNVERILGALQAARMLYGKAAGIPMILRRVQVEVSPEGKKKKVWTVEAQIDPDYSHLDLMHMVDSGRIVTALLPPVEEESYPPVDEDENDDAIDGEVVSASTEPASTASKQVVVCAEGKHDPAYNHTPTGRQLVCKVCGEVLEEETAPPPNLETPATPPAADKPDGPAPADLIRTIGNLMLSLRETWSGPDYLRLTNELKETFGWKDLNDYQKLTAKKAAECLARLRKANGEPE